MVLAWNTMNANNEFENIFTVNIRLCKILGLWSGNKVLCVTRLILQNFMCFCGFAHFIIADRDNGYLADFIEDIALFLSCICLTYTAVLFEIRHKDIIDLTKEMSTFEIFDVPTNFKIKHKFVNKVINIYNCFIVVSVVYYESLKTISKSQCLEQNERLNKFRVCGVLAQVPLWYEVTESPQNEILNFVQCITALICTTSTGLIFSFMFKIAEHIIIRFDYLKELFKLLDSDVSEKNKAEHLIKCIEYHNHIIGLVEKMNHCFSSTLFAAITVDTMAIATIIVQFLVESTLSAFLHLIAWVLSLFLLSLSGQRLYDQSSKLQNVVYDLKWYNESPKYRKYLQFIILRCEKNLFLQTGKLGIMFYPTFLKALKTSYSFVAVIKQRF